jgi:hypothetical protein
VMFCFLQVIYLKNVFHILPPCLVILVCSFIWLSYDAVSYALAY